MARIAVLLSGNGSNLQAIIDAIADKILPAQIVLVVSNRRAAHGLERARRARLASRYFPLHPFRQAGRSREDYDRELASLLATATPDLIVLAGWMHILSPPFLDAFPRRVINLHPALPGTFPGINAIARAFEAWRQGLINHSGVMIHYVTPEIDAGPLLASRIVPIEAQDQLADLERRVHATEHTLLIEVLRTLCTTSVAS